ncbi:hypothetical protein Desor_0374 [Desulfosporosinus orientis DSM 765]|uniref:Sporulation membrane protein YtrI C-terminal domain-containing protein n=1 Tax=Desulfosporosinus orientis (strain ATCC 19365 / DSM 765 / NCIMB 8382 / VKM B-1628 / Singapore I) TaxID=768706 RepID=G7W565_DESOD|nr:hypothetical protein [Desulfosporosinus orientis]AET66081.1 hypothetical protein Desor_0374 [Desulfosporosinus orientis DSM 765]
MKPLTKNGLKLKSCFFAGIIVGVIIGAAALNIVISNRMDSFYKQIAYLEQIIQDKNAILEKFEKNFNTRSLRIKRIDVVLDFRGDEIDRINIEKSIKDKYSSLLGKEVNSIDPELIIEVADKRILKIQGKEYKLKANKLIITEVMKIWIGIEPVTGP